jgi:hypothetical protein
MTRRIRLAALLMSVAGLALCVSPSQSTASVTIGQTATPAVCTGSFDRLQPTVTSGNTYVMPAAGTITSWSTQAIAGGGALGMKVFRPLGGARYLVVGHEGHNDLTGGVMNTFAANVAVKAGDVLGTFTPPNPNDPGCAFSVPGETFLGRPQNLPDGGEGDFAQANGFRMNISAVLDPTNTFTLGKPTLNKKRGTATLTVNVPNPGELTGSGNGGEVASAGAATSMAVPTGSATLLIKAKGKKKRKLNETGKVKLNIAVTYTPTGGDPSTQSVKVKLKKKL